MDDLFNRPLDMLLDAICSGRPTLEAVRRKVNALLTAYEDHCGRALRVSDVYVDPPYPGGEVLARKLLDYVAGLPLPADRSPARHRRRKWEDKSALRRLLREYLTDLGRRGDSEEQVSLAGMDEMPEGWEVLRKILCRRRPGRRPGKCAADSIPVGETSYSFASQHLVLALREVSTETGEKDLTVLLGKLYTDVTRAMKRNAPAANHSGLSSQFSTIRGRYFEAVGQPVPRRKVSLPLGSFPEPLKSQVEKFRSVARLGFGSSDKLRRVAKVYGFKGEPYRESSINSAVKSLEIGLGHIVAEKGEWAGRLGVEDLIATRPVEVRGKGGKVTDLRYVNDYVEVYRVKQWAAATPSKMAEFDSRNFEHFRSALILVAGVNGFGEHIEDFRKGYKLQLDRATRRDKKARKKKAFRRSDVDGEISRLKKEAFKIVNEGSFKTHRAGRDLETHRRMTKVLLLVNMSVLRYLGYRQQCLRVCRLGEHVFFNEDGSICFDFPEDVTKNGKHIRLTLSPGEHGSTHGQLLEILWKYYDCVYPYIQSRSPGVRDHLFVAVSPRTGNFRRYKGENDFEVYFTSWGKTHLRYEIFPGAQAQNFNLHPHFFRGLCVDWLLEDLGWGRDAVATFIGDEPETLREYINQNKIHDATKLLTQSNLLLKAEKEARERPRAEAELKTVKIEYEKALRAKEEQVQELLSQLRTMNELFEREKNEKDELLREIRQLRGSSSPVTDGGGKGNGGALSTTRPRRKERPTSRRRAGA